MRKSIPLVTAVAAALLFAAACPPYEWWWAAWLVPALLLVPLDGRRPLLAGLAGVLFGTIWGCTMAGWMRHASLAYFAFDDGMAAAFVLAVSLFYAGVPGGLLTASYAALSRRLPRAWLGLAGAWLWACSEVVRTHIFTGLPWELLGHTQFRRLALIQIADLGGAYAVSFVVALVSLSLGTLLVEARSQRRCARLLLHRLAPAALAVVAVLAYGARCRHLYAPRTGGEMRTVAVVQGNVANAFRWKREYFEQTLLTYARLSLPLREARPDLIVWPENAVNFYVDREPSFYPLLAAVASAARTGFLFGGPRLASDERSRVSAYLLGTDGAILGTYDKRRLLPFAEYDPLPALESAPLAGPISFTPGAATEVLQSGALRIGTLICYEVLFPSLLRQTVRQGAELLVNISNDSWLDAGDGAAPQQHFSMAAFSAIATRRYLVRASASGISGFVDPTGAPYALIPRATAGSAVGAVAPRHDLTLYVRWGDAWLALVGLAVALRLAHGWQGAPT